MRIFVAALSAGWLSLTGGQFIFVVPTGGTPLSCATASVYCVPSEYATIALANAAATHAGDIVWVSAGTYSVTVTPGSSGSAGNPITYLASGTVTVCSISFSAKSYVRFVGFTVDGNAASCSGSASLVSGSGANTGLEFWNMIVTNTTGHGYIWDYPSDSTRRCDKCIVFGGSVSNIGITSSSHGFAIEGNDTYIGYVDLSVICYIGIRPAGSRSRYINDNFSGFLQCNATHPDFFYAHGTSALGYSNGVIESVYALGTPTASDNKVHHIQNQGAQSWNDNVFRMSVIYNTGSASAHSIYGTGNILRWRQYNNDHVLGDRAVSGGNGTTCGGGDALGGTLTVYLYNSIYDRCWSDDNSSGVNPIGANWTPTAADYNLAYSSLGTISFLAGWTNQSHEISNSDPLLTSVGTDFTLQSGSPARGAGGPLTTATSCSGTTLNVAANTGSFFVGDNSANLAAYGGLLVPGDTITVNSTNYTVSSVSGDALTLATSISCSNGDNVYFGSSSTIDIGAYPYKAGGYTLTATKSCGGGTCTITPNDATLARFAVVYENLIPKCIAAASNSWACAVGSGVITAYIYPRYASATQAVLVN